MQGTIIANLVLQLFMSVSLQLMWGMVNTLQLFVQMPLLTLSYPSNAQLFCNTIFQLVQFKIFPTEKLEKLIFKINKESNSMVGSVFKENGIESTSVISNLGTMFFAGLGFIVLILFMVLIRKLVQKSAFAQKIYMIIHRKVFFNSILRTMVQSYLLLSLSTFINLKHFTLLGDTGLVFSSFLSVFIAIYLFVMPFMVAVFLYKYQKKLDDEDFNNRFGSLYLNVSSDNKKALMLTSLFIVRRLIYSFSIVFLEGYTFIQLPLLIYPSSIVLVFLIQVKPLNQKIFNQVEIFNELCIFVGGYLLYDFSDLESSSNMKYQVGWVMCVIMLVNFLTNWTLLIYKVAQVLGPLVKFQVMKQIKQRCKKKSDYDSEKNEMVKCDLELIEMSLKVKKDKKQRKGKKFRKANEEELAEGRKLSLNNELEEIKVEDFEVGGRNPIEMTRKVKRKRKSRKAKIEPNQRENQRLEHVPYSFYEVIKKGAEEFQQDTFYNNDELNQISRQAQVINHQDEDFEEIDFGNIQNEAQFQQTKNLFLGQLRYQVTPPSHENLSFNQDKELTHSNKSLLEQNEFIL